MALGQGYEAIAGVIKEAAWGTVLAVTKAIPFKKEGMKSSFDKIQDQVLRGVAGRHLLTSGNKTFKGPVTCELTYQDLDLLIAIAMGAAGTPSANGDLYDNIYSLAADISNSFTLAILKGVSVWEYAGCKIDKLKISGSANNPLDVEFDVVAKDLSRTSATNTAAILNALTVTDSGAKIMFSDLEFKMAAQNTALSGATEIGLSSFDLTLENNLAVDQFDSTGLTILQPQRKGVRAVKLTIEMPRYEADTYHDFVANATALHAYLKFTSGNYVFDIHLPKFYLVSGESNVDNDDLIPQKFEATCLRDPASASATFTLFEELEIAVTNGLAASPLA